MRVAWIALIVIVACGAWADSQPPSPITVEGSQHKESGVNPKDQDASGYKHGTADVPVVVKVLPAEPDHDKAAKQDQKDLHQTEMNDLYVHTNVFIACFTAVIAAFTIGLWWTDRDTRNRQLRAYIGVHQVGTVGLEDNNSLGVGFYFINHGQTPAKDFNLIGVIDLLPYPPSRWL